MYVLQETGFSHPGDECFQALLRDFAVVVSLEGTTELPVESDGFIRYVFEVDALFNKLLKHKRPSPSSQLVKSMTSKLTG